MINLAEEVTKYLGPRRQQRSLEFEFAGETFGCDPSISELTVPHVTIYVPKGFIRKYNLATIGKDSKSLPDANRLWKFLSSNLLGRGLVARNEEERRSSVDGVVKELLQWNHVERFEYNSKKGVLLEVKAGYDADWEETEEF
jgi:hypothetical protein